jgi:hypothetical protein
MRERANFSRLNGSMFEFPRIPCRLSLALVIALGAAASLPTFAVGQGTHLWTQSQLEDFEKGTPQGVAISSDGHLLEGPGLKDVLTTPSTFVWSVAADKNGVAYLGTGSPATVLRVGSDGKPFTLFESRDVSVQVVRLGPDGALYAAAMPSGKIYRLKAGADTKQDESSAAVVFDPAKLDGAKTDANKTDLDKAASRSHYVWDMAFDSAGRLYIATGDPGAVYRVDVSKPGSAAELFFKSDEAHIRALTWDAKGNLIAGSDGSGLVYRIDPQGKGYVLFEAPRREITSVTVAANGTIYAACVGDKSHNPLPPLPVQGIGSVTITIVQPGSVQAVNPSSAVPEGTEIYALAEGQAPRKVWSSKDDIVYGLLSLPDGLIAFTGNRGRIYRIQDDGSYADIGHLDAQQALSFAALSGSGGQDSNLRGGDFLIGTGNTGKLIRMGTAEQHEYASDVLDTGAMARFGRVEVEPGSQQYEILTRSGNVEQPVRGWSDWVPLKDGSIASPAGRFLQWKAVLRAGGVVGSVGVNYLPVNAAPVVDEIAVVTGARLQQNLISQQQTMSISLPSSGQGVVSFDANSNSTPMQATKDRTSITVRWAAHDDNGDDLTYALYLRGDSETVWRLLRDKITEKAYSFDAALMPDGGYELKVVASDAPSHTPGDALSGEKVSDRFVVDTTPPAVTGLRATRRIECGGAPCTSGVVVTFDAQDDTSPIAHAEYSLDAGPWQYIEPAGLISDSKTEHYDVQIPAADWKSEHLITVRAYDRYDNVGVAKTVVTVQGK